jgi:primary-amine oxidase
VVEEIEFSPSGDRTTWAINVMPLATEAARRVDQTRFRSWRVKDKVITNSEGHPISYHLEPDAAQVFRGPDIEPFTQNELYVTRYNACEKWVSFNPTTGGCADNVTGFVNGESVDGADVVVWYGHSFHHLPRDEDEPHMDAHWNSFLISPRDWTADNPLVGVTPASPTRQPNGDIRVFLPVIVK